MITNVTIPSPNLGRKNPMLSSLSESDSTSMDNNIVDIDDIDSKDLIYPGFQVGLDTDPVAVIIDGVNFYHLTRNLGINVDYKALSKVLYANFPNLRSKYYITSEHIKSNQDFTSERYREGHSPLRALIDHLKYSRWTVITRQVQVNDEDKNHASSMDVEIVCQLFQVAEWAKHIVFFGGSKKFAMPLRILKEKGITITVVATQNIQIRYVADELRKIDNYVDIGDDFFINLINNHNRKNNLTEIGMLKERR
jgi:uncharacterized LabA/DUF88 family protein